MSDANTLPSLLTMLAAPYALVLAVPGPNLLIMLRASLVPSSRRSAFAAAFGIASGATLAAAIAARLALAMPPSRIIEHLGGVIFALLLLRGAAGMALGSERSLLGDDPSTGIVRGGHFAFGLVAALFNPVTIPFFASFFLGNPAFSTYPATIYACATIFVMAILWFSLVSFVLEKSVSRRLLESAGRPLRYCISAGLLIFAILTLWRLAAL